MCANICVRAHVSVCVCEKKTNIENGIWTLVLCCALFYLLPPKNQPNENSSFYDQSSDKKQPVDLNDDVTTLKAHVCVSNWLSVPTLNFSHQIILIIVPQSPRWPLKVLHPENLTRRLKFEKHSFSLETTKQKWTPV